jgi:hypothetical protein
MSGLTKFQLEVAQLFFSLPASDGFLLAGGGALLASGLSTRPTEDLDFFGEVGRANVPAAAAQLVEASEAAGWVVHRIRSADTFIRLLIEGPDSVSIDFGIDIAPGQPPYITLAGPTFSAEELGARKLAALFGRAAPRDFVDVFVLVQRLGKQVLMDGAQALDGGFNAEVLADMIGSLPGVTDDELILAPDLIPELRNFFAEWMRELRAG